MICRTTKYKFAVFRYNLLALSYLGYIKSPTVGTFRVKVGLFFPAVGLFGVLRKGLLLAGGFVYVFNITLTLCNEFVMLYVV